LNGSPSSDCVADAFHRGHQTSVIAMRAATSLSTLTRSALAKQTQALVAKSATRGLASLAADLPETSSAQSSRSEWRAPIAPGVEPAYDEALKYIAWQQEQVRAKIPGLQKEVQASQPGTDERIAAEEALNSHQVASLINDPTILWRSRNNVDAPLTDPVFAHLREKAWRKNVLPRTTERIQLMRVVPDAVASVLPLVDVEVAFGQGTGIHDHGGDAGAVQVGSFVPPHVSLQQPNVRITPFHRDERLYTLALIDTDAPYEYEDKMGNYAHWLVANVPLSLAKTDVSTTKDQTIMQYIPPHPQQGTPYHRYALVVLEQSRGSIQVNTTAASIPESIESRLHFNVNHFAAEHQMRCVGLHFWREKWSEEAAAAVTSVYRDVLCAPERRYERLIGTIAKR
jgi:large subunit ribosomal protein L35